MKFIIYGFKLSQKNPHKYIHNGYYMAAKYLGYDTYWFDDNDTVNPNIYENSIILTEGWVTNKLPICKNSIYFIHHFGHPDKHQRFNHNIKYICNNNKVFDLRFLCEKFEDHNQKWDVKFSNLKQIDCCSYLETLSGYNAIYQPWATDVFPHEITFDLLNIPRENKIYFVGSIDKITTPHPFWGFKLDNYNRILRFKLACDENNIPLELIHYSTDELSYEQYHKIYKSSLLCPDIRNPHKLEVGYIPCRVFKSISYGQLGMTDSKCVYNFFNKLVAYHEDPYQLFYEGMKEKNNVKLIKEAMILVKENHTYINRIKALERCV